MIKKISAILLALVLCLTVVVVPASAEVVLGDTQVAFALEWDKEYYSAGETATISIYMDAADDLSLYTGAITIAFNSAVINSTDNPIADVKANSTTSDLFATYYKPASETTAWFTTAILLNKVKAANTAEEEALYDTYLKWTVAKNTSGGTHENTSANNAGFNGSDFDPTEPIATFSFVIADGVADGTAVNAAITTGTYSMTPAATAATNWKYYKNPGSATTTANLTAADFDASQAVATATIGEEPATFVPLTVSYWKDQVRFDTKADGSYYGTFDYRILATIDNFDEVIGTNYDMVTEVGFLFQRGEGANVDAATAQAELQAGNVTSYSQVKKVSVSTSYDGETYVMACTVNNIPDADKTTELSAMAYVEYVVDGVTYYAFSAVQTSTFEGLYNTYYSQAFPA